MGSYTYTPLRQDSKYIRVIRLRPALAFQETLHCEIIVEELHVNPPAYKAISYAWEGQSQSQDHFIVCHDKDGDGEGKKLLLTRNCEAALRHVHLAIDSRVVWIDSICIDQTSIQERNHQVGIMGDIYAFAQRVLVWLGEDPTLDGERTFQWLQDFAQGDHENIDDRRRLESKVKQILEASENISEPDRLYSWSIISKVFGRPWFRRMWTLQEIALTNINETIFLCGRQSIKLEEIIKAHNCLVDLKCYHYRLIADAINVYCDLHHYVVSRRTTEVSDRLRAMSNPKKKDKPFPLISGVFGQARRKEASDPKDKVFALYGLCTELGVLMPHPDYAKSLSQIYSEATKSIIEHDEELDVLYMINTPRCSVNLPSWVPDWSDHWKTEGNYPISFALAYQASQSKALYSFDPNCQTLTVLSKIIDTISFIGKGIPVFEENDGPWGPDLDQDHNRGLELWKKFQEWAKCIEQRAGDNTTPYGGSELDVIAFYFTITQDVPLKAGEVRRSKNDATTNEGQQKDIAAFRCWYDYLVRGEKKLERELLERGMMPEQITTEFLTDFNMVCALQVDGKDLAGNFQHEVWGLNRGKTFFMSEQGWMGMAEGEIQEGYCSSW